MSKFLNIPGPEFLKVARESKKRQSDWKPHKDRRKREVLELHKRGKDSFTIAARLNITISQVEEIVKEG